MHFHIILHILLLFSSKWLGLLDLLWPLVLFLITIIIAISWILRSDFLQGLQEVIEVLVACLYRSNVIQALALVLVSIWSLRFLIKNVTITSFIIVVAYWLIKIIETHIDHLFVIGSTWDRLECIIHTATGSSSTVWCYWVAFIVDLRPTNIVDARVNQLSVFFIEYGTKLRLLRSRILQLFLILLIHRVQLNLLVAVGSSWEPLPLISARLLYLVIDVRGHIIIWVKSMVVAYSVFPSSLGFTGHFWNIWLNYTFLAFRCIRTCHFTVLIHIIHLIDNSLVWWRCDIVILHGSVIFLVHFSMDIFIIRILCSCSILVFVFFKNEHLILLFLVSESLLSFL